MFFFYRNIHLLLFSNKNIKGRVIKNIKEDPSDWQNEFGRKVVWENVLDEKCNWTERMYLIIFLKTRFGWLSN